jgi:transposase
MRRAGRTPGGSSSKRFKLNPKDQSAIRIVAQMDELFAIDARARERGLSHPDRDVVRQQRARPLLKQIKMSIETAQLDSLPKSALAKACNYTLTLWQRLTRFLDYSVLELSNNLAENAIRPVALGRKNWIHLGSQEAGPRIAAIVSVVQSCRRLKIPVRDYLRSVVPGLADCQCIESQAHACCVGRQQKITVANPSRSQPCRW